jgi:hypothetical protein
MTRPTVWMALALALAIGLVTSSAQTPARDAAREPAPGTATVSGIVVTGDAPARPLRRVTVTLLSASLTAPISAVTGDDGRFELTGVAAGHYTVRASRPGYVDTVLGAPPGGILGAPIAVAEGERLTGISIPMPRGGVITGTVRFANGRPAREVEVQVSPIRTVDGRRRARFTTGLGMVHTDDRGMYRQFGLPPGEYVVQLTAGGSPMRGAAAVRRTSADEIAWAERLVADASGSPAGSPARAEPPPGRAMTLAPIYYPGTTSLETARAIALEAGEERSGIDLIMEYVPAVRVTGVVRAPDGSPQPGATVRLNPAGEAQSPADIIGALLGRGAQSDATGAFAIDDVPPGEYTLMAQAARAADAGAAEAETGPPNLMAMFSTMFGRGGGAGALHAAAPVVVTGADVEGVELRLAEGSTVSGRVVFEGTTDPPSPSTMQVMLAAVSESASAMEQALSMAQGASGQVASDLTFAIRGVPPDRYRATVILPGSMFGAMLPNAVWAVKSIRAADGTDLADVPFDLIPGRDLEGLVATLTDRPAVLSGTVLDGEGRPSSAFPIIIFSTDSSHWMVGSRRVQQVRPASDGTYRITGLPAGEYYVGAVTTLELDDLYAPAFLQQIVPIAFTIAIADGEAKEQDLRIGG